MTRQNDSAAETEASFNSSIRIGYGKKVYHVCTEIGNWFVLHVHLAWYKLYKFQSVQYGEGRTYAKHLCWHQIKLSPETSISPAGVKHVTLRIADETRGILPTGQVNMYYIYIVTIGYCGIWSAIFSSIDQGDSMETVELFPCHFYQIECYHRNDEALWSHTQSRCHNSSQITCNKKCIDSFLFSFERISIECVHVKKSILFNDFFG